MIKKVYFWTAQSTLKFEVLLSKWLAHSHNPSHDKQSFAPKANVLLFAERSQHFQVLQIYVHSLHIEKLPPERFFVEREKTPARPQPGEVQTTISGKHTLQEMHF